MPEGVPVGPVRERLGVREEDKERREEQERVPLPVAETVGRCV